MDSLLWYLKVKPLNKNPAIGIDIVTLLAALQKALKEALDPSRGLKEPLKETGGLKLGTPHGHQLKASL